LSRRKKLCFAAVVLGIVLVSGELGIRLFAYLTHRERLYQLDPVAGYTCKPNLAHKLKRLGEYEFCYTTDSRGFRVTAPNGTIRRGEPVILVGDSFVFGYCVNDEDSLGYILSSETGRPVVSVGAPGYSPDIYLPLLRELIVTTAAKSQVILLICDNDFQDVTYRFRKHRPKPYFERRDSAYVEHTPEIGWLDRIMDSSELAYLVLSNVLTRDRSTNISLEESPRLLAHIMSEIQAVCDSHGLRLTTLLFERHHPEISPEMRDEFISRCKTHGVNVEAITTELRAGVDYRSLLTVDDEHWNRQGSEKVAQIIGRRLR
jgi:hypothetical protein